ncbi:MAG TPA: helix-turn-helix domain-containing protein [Candidatus Cybelea sp.]|nr:helix-turn-helix domain-containing protein [Candidatus Cybelea sp.]
MPESFAWTQMEPGLFESEHRIVRLDAMRVGWHRSNLGFKLEADLKPHRFVIGILASGSTCARWFGTGVDEGHVAASGASIWLSTAGPSAFLSVTADARRLARDFPDSPDARVLMENAGDVSLERNDFFARRLREYLQWLSRDSTKSSGFLRHATRALVKRALLPLLADAVAGPHGPGAERSPSLNRRVAAVRICEAYMHEHLDKTVTLVDLSGISGLRLRSLINAFQAVTGFSPMAYFKRERLNGVRQALQRPRRARTRVIDVATAWGFWHMGHFTADYREMFGESPSETLRTS